jgi:hypothetical protein
MQKMLTIFLTQGSKSRGNQNKLNGIKKITFSRAISSNNYIVFRTFNRVETEINEEKVYRVDQSSRLPEWKNIFIILISKTPESRDE